MIKKSHDNYQSGLLLSNLKVNTNKIKYISDWLFLMLSHFRSH